MKYSILTGIGIESSDLYQRRIQVVIPVYGKRVLMAYLATGFQEADRDNSGRLISCLGAIETNPFFSRVKEESYRLLHLPQGSRVLDVGCGTGSDVRRLTALVGAGGMVVGVDPGISMLNEAFRAGSSVSSHEGRSASFIRMDGRHLAFPDSCFDGVWEDRALQHIGNPQEVIREMFRVLRPEGWFVFFEPDWELFIIDGPERELTRKILNFWADSFMNGWIGRRLLRLCHDCDAGEVSVLARTMIMNDLSTCDRIFGIRDTVRLAVEKEVIDDEAGSRWLSVLENDDRSGRFFASFTGYLVYGRKRSIG